MQAVKLLILFHQGKEHRMLQINKFDNYCFNNNISVRPHWAINHFRFSLFRFDSNTIRMPRGFNYFGY